MAAAQTTTPETVGPGRAARILVVDDEYGVRSAVRQVLEMEGYQVSAAATGEEALALLHAPEPGGGYDIVLLDHRLPDTDGLTLHKRIMASGHQPMTCMITAYADIDLACAATFQGVDFFLAKPFLPDELLGVVETLLRRLRAREEGERLRREHEANLLALAEEKTQTRSLLASLRDAVLVVNREDDVVLVNEAMAGLLGTTEDDLLRRPVGEVLLGGPLDSLLSPLRKPLKDRTVGQLLLGERTFAYSIVTFRGEDDTALGRIVTLSDISEIRRLALEKERFIRTMVHELKAPLGAVRGLIEVTTDKSLGEDLDSYLPLLRRAEERIDGLVRLIGDLLLLSRSEQALTPTEPELLDVARAVETALAAQAEALAKANLTSCTEFEPGLPPVLLPAEDLDLVLANLISNAVKYNREGGSLTVRGRREDRWVRIDIEDTGLGIAPENLDRVFSEFFRERRPETRDVEGSGLGLTIVKRLVERAGGRVQVRSTEGVGSTFSVFLPA
jgi:two-component system phosphate regulon sensor histidine kinase PhoR